MGKRPELYFIQEPQARVERNAPRPRLLCSHETASPRTVARPWPRQVDWRTFPRPK